MTGAHTRPEDRQRNTHTHTHTERERERERQTEKQLLGIANEYRAPYQDSLPDPSSNTRLGDVTRISAEDFMAPADSPATSLECAV